MKSGGAFLTKAGIVVGFILLSIGLWWTLRNLRPDQETAELESSKELAKSDILFQLNHIDLGDRFANSAPFWATFPFQNFGNTTIKLVVKACCGSRATFKDGKILYLPGEKGELSLQILTPKKAEKDSIHRIATVFQEGFSKPIAELEVVANIKRHWQVKPIELKFGEVKPGEVVKAELVVEAGTDEEQGLIRGFETGSELVEITQLDQDISSLVKRYVYQISLVGDKVARHFESNVTFQTTNSKMAEVVVPISAEFSGTIEVAPKSLYFGQVEPQSVVSKSLHIISKNTEPIKILKVSSENEYVFLEDIPPDGKAHQVSLNFTIKVPQNAQGVLRGNIRIECKTSEEFEIKIPWVAIVTVR